MNIQEVYTLAQAVTPWAVERRRALHRIPERGFEEFETSTLIRETLDALDIPYTAMGTATIGTIEGAAEGETIALRADIDALPVTEPEGCPFRSEHEGWMHACGHDMHTAILLGAAKVLSEHRDALRGNVRLLFQPAEETDGGAKPMVEAGAMEGVSRVYGLHVQPYMNVGTIDSRPGTLNASTDEINITVHGVSSHAARPEGGVDAVVCAAQLIMTLQSIVSRNVTPLKPAVLTFGTIEGGKARNIICDEVTLHGTLRCADNELRVYMKNRIREIAEGVSEAFGAKIDVNIVEGYCALINDADEVARVFSLGEKLLGKEHVLLRESPSMGGEDFSYFVREAKGAFYHLGCAASQPAPTLHSADFVPDERCMPIGIALQTALALQMA